MSTDNYGKPIFGVQFSGGQFCNPNFLELWVSAWIKFGQEIGESLALPMHLLDFWNVASFWKQSVLKLTESKTEAKFCTSHGA